MISIRRWIRECAFYGDRISDLDLQGGDLGSGGSQLLRGEFAEQNTSLWRAIEE